MIHIDRVKKIVALSRQKSSFVAMFKRGDLTSDECKAAVAGVDAQIAAVRAQAELPGLDEGVPSPAPSPAPKGR